MLELTKLLAPLVLARCFYQFLEGLAVAPRCLEELNELMREGLLKRQCLEHEALSEDLVAYVFFYVFYVNSPHKIYVVH